MSSLKATVLFLLLLMDGAPFSLEISHCPAGALVVGTITATANLTGFGNVVFTSTDSLNTEITV